METALLDTRNTLVFDLAQDNIANEGGIAIQSLYRNPTDVGVELQTGRYRNRAVSLVYAEVLQ